jgi:hypothetical protein
MSNPSTRDSRQDNQRSAFPVEGEVRRPLTLQLPREHNNRQVYAEDPVSPHDMEATLRGCRGVASGSGALASSVSNYKKPIPGSQIKSHSWRSRITQPGYKMSSLTAIISGVLWSTGSA